MSDEEQKQPETAVEETAAAAPVVTQEWLDANPDTTLKIGDPIPVPRDLDQERDDRVIPVAQGVLEDIAAKDIAAADDRSEFTNVIVNILKRALAADLNITTDNSYVFQLVLGAYGAFNQFIISCKMADDQNVRYSKIAHELMALFAQAKVPMGMKVKTEEQIAALEPIRSQVEEIFAREMLTKLEVTYILEGLLNAFKVTHQVFDNNLQDAVDRLQAKILQLDSLSDLTMKKLDDTLTTAIEEILKKSAK